MPKAQVELKMLKDSRWAGVLLERTREEDTDRLEAPDPYISAGRPR